MKLVQFYDNGWRVALLVKEGRVHAHLIPMDAKGLRVVRVDAERDLEFKYFDAAALPAALEKFRAFGRRVGMTQAVKDYLGIKDGA